MKIISYVLIIFSFAPLILTDVITETKVEDINIQQEMFESQKGRKLIISHFKVKDDALVLKLASNNAFTFLFVIGFALFLFDRIKKNEDKLKKLENLVNEIEISSNRKRD